MTSCASVEFSDLSEEHTGSILEF